MIKIVRDARDGARAVTQTLASDLRAWRIDPIRVDIEGLDPTRPY